MVMFYRMMKMSEQQSLFGQKLNEKYDLKFCK